MNLIPSLAYTDVQTGLQIFALCKKGPDGELIVVRHVVCDAAGTILGEATTLEAAHLELEAIKQRLLEENDTPESPRSRMRM
jgi:hypothetical protein